MKKVTDRAFIDTNIPMYAAGRDHPYQKSCRNVLTRIVEGSIDGVTDTEVFQEILYRYYHIGKMDTGLKLFESFLDVMTGKIMLCDEAVLQVTARLTHMYKKIKPRDIIHAAIMLVNDISVVISADKDFDRIKEIKRIDPMELSP